MLKNEEPQINANKTNNKKSKVLASFIILKCIYVIIAYLIYIFYITIKKFLIYVQHEFKNKILKEFQ